MLDGAGKPVKPGETGTLAVKLPLPPSCLPTLWNNDERFRKSYLAEFPGYYTTSDAGYIDADGYAYVMARTDDVINVAGHRLSTGQMEEVVATPQGCGRVRRGRRGRRDEGPDPRRLHRAQRRRQPPAARRSRARW